MQKIKLIQIQQFKLQIDHQIAKCLDTLDRQGLKFLRQTLKTSNLFSSTNLESIQYHANQYQSQPAKNITSQLHNSQHSYGNQSIKTQLKNSKAELKTSNSRQKNYQKNNYASVANALNKPKVTQQKKDSAKQLKQKVNKDPKKEKEIKKTNTDSRTKKIIVIQNEKTNQKISLGQKINKKMMEYNISRVGPTAQNTKKSKVSSNKKQADKFKVQKISQPNIQQDVQQVIQQEIRQSPQRSPLKKQSNLLAKEKFIFSPEKPIILKQKPNPLRTVKSKAEQIVSKQDLESQQTLVKEQDNISKMHQQVQNALINKNARRQDTKVNTKLNKQSQLWQVEQTVKEQKLLSQLSHNKIQIQSIIQANQIQDESRVKQLYQKKQIDQQIEQISESIQVGDDLQQYQSNHINQTQGMNFPEISSLVQKINKLSPNKFLQVQKLIDFMENTPSSELNESNKEKYEIPIFFQKINQSSSIINQMQQRKSHLKMDSQSEEASYVKNQGISSNIKPSFFINQKDSSKKNLKQKKQKASLIFNNSKSASRSRIKIDPQFQEDQCNRNIIQNNMNSKASQNQQNNCKNQMHLSYTDQLNLLKIHEKLNKNKQQSTLKQQKPLKMEKIDFKQPKQMSNFSRANQKMQQNISLHKSNNIQNNSIVKIKSSEVKMLNLNSKRSPIKGNQQAKTAIKFKILLNRGHSSVFGLTGIQLYTIFNKKVNITQKQLAQNQTSLNKLLKLFNGNNFTTDQSNMYTSSLNKNQIILLLDKEDSKIGGIRIFNYNKSSLESDKQVKQLEIYHNNEKIWKGSLKNGSYNQNANYSTQIQIVPNFQFENLINSSKVKQPFSENQEKQRLWIQKQQAEAKIRELEKQDVNMQKNQLYSAQNRKSIAQINKNMQNQSDVQMIKKSKQLLNLSKSIAFQKILKTDKNQLNQISQSRIGKLTNQKKKSNKSLSPNKNNNYDQFDTMLKGLQQNISREKSKSKLLPSVSVQSIQKETKKIIPNKNNAKLIDNKSKLVDDFMNDSIFQEKPQYSRIPSGKNRASTKNQDQKIVQNSADFNGQQLKKVDKKPLNIDDFLGELQDVIDKKSLDKKNILSQKQFSIPCDPSGQSVQIQILENWGHQAYVGLQGIQFFDKNGISINPKQVFSNKNNLNLNLLQSLSNKNLMNKDEKIQTKIGFNKSQRTTITFKFSQSKIFSLIRIWNYNGQRVHSNIGIRYCLIKINRQNAFMGEIKKNQSTPQNFHKHFQAIVLTNNQATLKKIRQNDWLKQIKNKIKQQKELFKSTLFNFNRPKTKNNQDKNQISTKNQKNLIQRQIKLPKRNCWEYQPPQLPQGNILVFFLHDTWGDTNFIGLNGIQIFDGLGKLIKRQNISKIKAFPNTTGQKNDKRIVQNLINGNNMSSNDGNIWLSTFQTDIQKIQSGKPNTIIIELNKKTKISGINIYNYSKTPERGVRQIQIQLNSLIIFRGYVKIFDQSNVENIAHTSINFTKDIQILKNMNYEGYNQDNVDQNIAFMNQRKVSKI